MANHEADIQRCACGNLRKTARAVTQFYDRFFEELGIRSTQWSLLTRIYMDGSVSVGELADRLLMDQTTVTRNIGILKKLGYVTVSKETDDARRKAIALTESGRQKLKDALPRWQEAQERIEIGMGERYSEFLMLLKNVEELVK